MNLREVINKAKKELKKVAEFSQSEMVLQRHLDYLSDDLFTMIGEAGSITVSDDSDTE